MTGTAWGLWVMAWVGYFVYSYLLLCAHHWWTVIHSIQLMSSCTGFCPVKSWVHAVWSYSGSWWGFNCVIHKSLHRWTCHWLFLSLLEDWRIPHPVFVGMFLLLCWIQKALWWIEICHKGYWNGWEDSTLHLMAAANILISCQWWWNI